MLFAIFQSKSPSGGIVQELFADTPDASKDTCTTAYVPKTTLAAEIETEGLTTQYGVATEAEELLANWACLLLLSDLIS